MADAHSLAHILKSTWGTRMTPSDVKAQERAEKKRKIFNKTVLRREGYK